VFWEKIIYAQLLNVAETYKICESSETHTSQNISCMSVAEIKLKLANLGVIKQDRNLLNQLISFNNSTFEGLKLIYWFSINLLTGMQKHTK
jgi:hypothetical protein